VIIIGIIGGAALLLARLADPDPTDRRRQDSTN
jgi:hypothetical protein